MSNPIIEPPAAAPAATPDKDKPKYATIKDLQDELFRRARIDDDDFQLLDRFTYDDKTIIVGQPNPVNSNFVVRQAFQDDAEVRCYEVPHKNATPPEGPLSVALGPRRISYPKHGTRCGPVCERMSFERMVTLVAEEISTIVNGVQTAMMERLAVVEFLRAQHPATAVAGIIKKIEEGEHVPDEDEELEEQVAGAVNGTPAS